MKLEKLTRPKQLREGDTVTEVHDGNIIKYKVGHIIVLPNINSAWIELLHWNDKKISIRLSEAKAREIYVGYDEAFLLDKAIDQVQAKLQTLLDRKFEAENRDR